ALQTLLPQIRAEIREEFRTSSGPSDAGRNPPPVTIHVWLERFNKQKPHSFKKATAPRPRVVMPGWSRFLGAAAGTEEEQAKNFQWGRGVVIGISRPFSRIVTGATVIIATVMDQTGEVVMTTTAVATTTLAVTTG
nr:hypothetical protein [Tanacetum cinerariifolium]